LPLENHDHTLHSITLHYIICTCRSYPMSAFDFTPYIRPGDLFDHERSPLFPVERNEFALFLKAKKTLNEEIKALEDAIQDYEQKIEGLKNEMRLSELTLKGKQNALTFQQSSFESTMERTRVVFVLSGYINPQFFTLDKIQAVLPGKFSEIIVIEVSNTEVLNKWASQTTMNDLWIFVTRPTNESFTSEDFYYDVSFVLKKLNLEELSYVLSLIIDHIPTLRVLLFTPMLGGSAGKFGFIPNANITEEYYSEMLKLLCKKLNGKLDAKNVYPIVYERYPDDNSGVERTRIDNTTWEDSIVNCVADFIVERSSMSPANSLKRIQCVACKSKTSSFACQQCYLATYCSQACQQSDWVKSGGHAQQCLGSREASYSTLY
jgi:hypothetical protein